MATNARSYLSDDNQIPCSSNNYGYQPLYPVNNPTIGTPHSPYCHSSGPPSVSMTPATPFIPQAMESLGPVPPAYTQTWIHNYHDAVQIARPHSSAQSVMSDMTMFSGISVNTHATTASYVMPPGIIPPPGPLSSRSHSENVDPSDDLINSLKQIMLYMFDEADEVRNKSSMMLIQIPDKIKLTEVNTASMSEAIINCTKSIVRALTVEQNTNNRVLFCDALCRFANNFSTLFGKMLMIDPNQPDNALRTLLGFFATGVQVDPRFLRHLFPALYVCISTTAGRACIQAAKNTNFVWFIYGTVRDNFITHSKNIQIYQSRMKFFVRYLEMLRYFIRFDDNIRFELVSKGVIDLLLNITRFHCIHHKVLTSKFLTTYHNQITAMLKLIVTTDSNEITDAFVKSSAIEVLLTAVYIFRGINILNQHMLTYTFTSLAYVGHSNMLQSISPRLPIIDIDMFHVIQMETVRSQETHDFEMFKLISEFVVNASRHSVLQLQIIQSGHHEILADNFFRLFRQLDKKYKEVSDNCLLTLYRLCYVNSDTMYTKFCQMFFSPRFTSEFVKIFSPECSTELIKRALNIWKVLFPKVQHQLFIDVYSSIEFYIIKEILDMIKLFVTKYKENHSYGDMIKLCVDLLIMFIQEPVCYPQLQYLNQFNVVAILFEVANDNLSFYLLTFINKLLEQYPDLVNSYLSSDMLREFLVKSITSSHTPLVALSKGMLTNYYNDNSYNFTF